jgi:hypothetical protein
MIDYQLGHVYRVKVVIRPLPLVVSRQNHVKPPGVAEAPNRTG